MARRTNSHFQKGSGVFTCDGCGRQTRHTGIQSVDSKCCAECYELAGIQNGFYDEGTFNPVEVSMLIKEIEAKGGNAASVRAEYPDLFPNS